MNLEKYMIPCLFKKLFGFECLGCGFQRSVFLLFKGDFLGAFKMYPAIFTSLFFLVFAAFHFFNKSKKHQKLFWQVAFVNLAFMIGGYIYKHFI
ncbi:DUF2752 domain-containing protein [Flavobacterium foetidum]|uniref:DUF2752 domain-containing protein n=1 Tax=Flavobacterium foetidum TaxID=2026681 RepID=UPI00107589A8|nr:DUF2752 domain-containing protein [Flavobacterium foetidum]KAF2517784.1 DUF2752 domain-containing protein [Flavobacterium foetidum]